MLPIQYPIILNSGGSDASEVTEDGSQFRVYFDNAISIPPEALYCYVTVPEATIWNVVYNVVAGVNDTFYVEYDDGILVVNTTITIIPGLYDVDHLNSALLRELNNNVTVPSDLFLILPDTASNRAVIQFNYSGTQLDFTQSNTMREILGFESRLVPLAPTSGVSYELGDTIATFNNLNYFTIACDILTRGIPTNNSYNQTVVKVPADSPPGSEINYRSYTEIQIPATELIGVKITSLTVWLTDDNLQRVNTAGESFSLTLIIHYFMPLDALVKPGR